MNAIQRDDVATVRSLIRDPRVDVNTPTGEGATALHWAAYRDALDILDALLATGARATAANDYGVTPVLHGTAFYGLGGVARLLIAHGAGDLNLRARRTRRLSESGKAP
jgi:ankyrin repeat protein